MRSETVSTSCLIVVSHCCCLYHKRSNQASESREITAPVNSAKSNLQPRRRRRRRSQENLLVYTSRRSGLQYSGGFESQRIRITENSNHRESQRIRVTENQELEEKKKKRKEKKRKEKRRKEEKQLSRRRKPGPVLRQQQVVVRRKKKPSPVLRQQQVVVLMSPGGIRMSRARLYSNTVCITFTHVGKPTRDGKHCCLLVAAMTWRCLTHAGPSMGASRRVMCQSVTVTAQRDSWCREQQ